SVPSHALELSLHHLKIQDIPCCEPLSKYFDQYLKAKIRFHIYIKSSQPAAYIIGSSRQVNKQHLTNYLTLSIGWNYL
ncbi:13015_t:CDS:1, partial [Dentiscutata erythropus]